MWNFWIKFAVLFYDKNLSQKKLFWPEWSFIKSVPWRPWSGTRGGRRSRSRRPSRTSWNCKSGWWRQFFWVGGSMSFLVSDLLCMPSPPPRPSVFQLFFSCPPPFKPGRPESPCTSQRPLVTWQPFSIRIIVSFIHYGSNSMPFSE
jgi:hypothetical protein